MKINFTDSELFIGTMYFNDESVWWRKDGKLHREDGPAVIYANGGQHWFINGKRHREDGPAIIFQNGYWAWFIDGKRHREDGPAIVDTTGEEKYWIAGNELTEEEFNQRKCSPNEVVVNGSTYKRA